MSAALQQTWRNLPRAWQAVLTGGLLVVVGVAIELFAGARNVNGVDGPALVVLLTALLAGLAVALSGRWPVLAGPAFGATAGGLAVALLEAIHPARYSADLDFFGGPAGLVGRLLALAGLIVLVGVAGAGWRGRRTAGAVQRPLLSAGRRPSARLLLGIGTALLIGGWLLLLAVAEGFAMRAVDGVGVVLSAVALALTGGSVGTSQQRTAGVAWRALAIALAAGAVLVVVDSLPSVIDRSPQLLAAGVVPLLSYLVYLGGGLALAVGAVLAGLDLLHVASPPAAATRGA